MVNGEAIPFNGKRIAAVLNSLRNYIREEVGLRIIKWILPGEPPLNNPGERVTCVGDVGGELFSNSCFLKNVFRNVYCG